MGANNWALCPGCKRNEEERQAALKEKANAVYSTILPEEFTRLISEALAPIQLKETFREDYEIGIYGDEFFIDYIGSCSKCGLEKKFKHSEKI
jgi:hypothetical protein